MFKLNISFIQIDMTGTRVAKRGHELFKKIAQ